jgi:glutathione S-transferase
MYTLYARKGAGSAAVEAVLSQCGVAFEVVDVPKNPDGSPPEWFLAVNPHGEVPALKLGDGTVLTESGALVMHLADCHTAAGLAPAIGTPARATYMRAIFRMASNVYGADLRFYYPARNSTDPAHAPFIRTRAIEDLNREFDAFEASLGAGPFVLGETLSAADIYAAMLISWSEDFGKLTARLPRLRTLYDGVSALPAVRKVWDRNDMP